MIKLDSVTFSYEYGDETFTVHTRRSIRSDLVSLNISTEGDVFTASLESSGSKKGKTASHILLLHFARNSAI